MFDWSNMPVWLQLLIAVAGSIALCFVVSRTAGIIWQMHETKSKIRQRQRMLEKQKPEE